MKNRRKKGEPEHLVDSIKMGYMHMTQKMEIIALCLIWAAIASIGCLAAWWIFFKRAQEINNRIGGAALGMISIGMAISWIVFILSFHEYMETYLFNVWLLSFWFIMFPVTVLRRWYTPLLGRYGVRENKINIRIGARTINLVDVWFLLVHLTMLYLILTL